MKIKANSGGVKVKMTLFGHDIDVVFLKDELSTIYHAYSVPKEFNPDDSIAQEIKKPEEKQLSSVWEEAKELALKEYGATWLNITGVSFVVVNVPVLFDENIDDFLDTNKLSEGKTFHYFDKDKKRQSKKLKKSEFNGNWNEVEFLNKFAQDEGGINGSSLFTLNKKAMWQRKLLVKIAVSISPKGPVAKEVLNPVFFEIRKMMIAEEKAAWMKEKKKTALDWELYWQTKSEEVNSIKESVEKIHSRRNKGEKPTVPEMTEYKKDPNEPKGNKGYKDIKDWEKKGGSTNKDRFFKAFDIVFNDVKKKKILVYKSLGGGDNFNFHSIEAFFKNDLSISFRNRLKKLYNDPDNKLDEHPKLALPDEFKDGDKWHFPSIEERLTLGLSNFVPKKAEKSKEASAGESLKKLLESIKKL